MAQTQTYAQLPTDANGYVLGIRCGQYHSGNTRLHQDGRACWCQGCASVYPTEDVWQAIGRLGEAGHGSLYDGRGGAR